MQGFGDRLMAAARSRGPLCVGIDPHPGKIPSFLGGDTAQGARDWALAVVEAVAPFAACLKPQIGLFERFGPEGMEACAAVLKVARERGVLTIADAKRGDIGSTAEGYAAAYLDPGAPFEADCVTVNPYMGLDTLEPFFVRAEANGRGVAVLARTSNPGSADFQTRDMGGAMLFERVVDALQPAAERLSRGGEWSSLMLVSGATGPGEARRIRARSANTPFLVPGYGAQGAGASDAVAGFVPGPEGRLAGGVVNASRSITFGEDALAANCPTSYIQAVARAARAAQAELNAAIGQPSMTGEPDA